MLVKWLIVKHLISNIISLDIERSGDWISIEIFENSFFIVKIIQVKPGIKHMKLLYQNMI